jgi:chromatin remodeling complex protein RSC6
MSEILIEQNNDDNISNNLFEQFDVIINSMNVLKTQITLTQQNLKLLEKNLKKQMKNLKKEVIKNKNKNKGNRKPSGFAKPSKVTKELCYFMNKTEGTEIARTEVTKALVSYIKENKLENDVNSRIISPDNKLKVLLGIEDGEELTYFNIQKYMNKHFVKKEEL